MSVFQAVAQALMAVQSEIAIFIIAFCAHTLIFGKYRFNSTSLKSKWLRVPKQGSPHGMQGALAANTPRLPKVTPFARSIKMLLQQGADKEILVQELTKHLQSCPQKAAIDELVELLEYTGKATTVEFLTAIRKALQNCKLQPQGRLVDFMMRSYLVLHAPNELDKLVAEVENMEGITMGTVFLYLRDALRLSDLKVVLIRVKNFACFLQTNVTQTPSIAFKGLMQQLVRLAFEQAELFMLLKELNDIGLFTSWVLDHVLTECVQKKDISTMKEVGEFAFANNVEFTTTSYCLLLRGAHGHREILDIYDRHLTGIDVDFCAGKLVLEAAFHCHRPEVVTQLLALSKETPKQVALLKSFAVERRKDEVIAIFKACPDKNTCLYNALLSACIDCQDMKAAEHVMSEAVAGGIADVVTYNTIIKAHLLAQDTRRARVAMEAMRVAGFAPNSVTFNELINATIRTNIHDTWALIDEMEACGLKPNQITCSILLKSIQRDSRTVDVERSLALLDSMEEEMDEVLLSSACEACIRAGQTDFLLVQLARQRTNKRVHVKGAHTFGSLIRAYGFVRDISGAWDMWKEMRAHGIIPTSITIGCMVEALVLNEDVQAGYELIRQLLNNEETRPLVNAIIYCSVLKGFSHQKNFAQVWAVYQEMLVEKVQLSIATYNALIDACARNSEMSCVPVFLEEMCSQGIKPNIVTYCTILKGYCNEHAIEKALELLDDMKKTMEFQPDEITYNTLLDGCARMGLYERGVGLLHDMQKQGVRPSSFTLSVVAKLATRSKRPEKAFELCEQISRKYSIRLNVHVYNNLVQACTVFGDIQHALKIFQKMLQEKVRPDARTYTLLLRGCVAMKQTRDAAGLLRAAMGLPGAHPEVAAFGHSLLQLREDINPEIITYVLEHISNQCGDDQVAMQLLMELRSLPKLRLNSKLSLRLTSKAISIR